jgi:hypothetical protein
MLSVCVGVGVAVSFTLIACDGDRAAALAIRSGQCSEKPFDISERL